MLTNKKKTTLADANVFQSKDIANFYNVFLQNPKIFISILKDIIYYPYEFDATSLHSPVENFSSAELEEVDNTKVWRLGIKSPYTDNVDFILVNKLSNDFYTPFKMMAYKYSYACTVAYKKRCSDKKKLYPIILLVIYNGNLEWTAELDAYNVTSFMPRDNNDANKYINDFNTYYGYEDKYILVDIYHMNIDDIPKDSPLRPLVMVEQSTDLKSLNNAIQEAIRIYDGDDFIDVCNVLLNLIVNIPCIHKKVAKKVGNIPKNLKELHRILTENFVKFERDLCKEMKFNIIKDIAGLLAGAIAMDLNEKLTK